MITQEEQDEADREKEAEILRQEMKYVRLLLLRCLKFMASKLAQVE